MVNGNSLYGQGNGFSYQLAMAMAARSQEPGEVVPTPATDSVTLSGKSFQHHLAEALKNEA